MNHKWLKSFNLVFGWALSLLGQPKVSGRNGGQFTTAVSIGTLLRTARLATNIYRATTIVQSSWWDDVFGEEANKIKEEIKAIEIELEYCAQQKDDRDSECAHDAKELKDNDAQPWHVRQKMQQCLDRSQLEFETCAKPLWQRLSELRNGLRDLP